MSKETLWAVLIVTTVVTVGVAGVGWDAWKEHLHSTDQQSAENNLSNKEDGLSNQVIEPVQHSQPSSLIQNDNDSIQSSEKVNHTTNGVQSTAQALQPTPSQAMTETVDNLQPSIDQDNLSTATRNQRTRIIVKDPIVLDGVDVMAELKGKELSAEEAIKTMDEES
ncbi:hypothetical protein [Spartinivicinus poritis]|uniref:Uncharacterized protein n=1 Tax=Spartinivicinus poritis TaxID=2994640 RepID=A0ABT5UDA1_9GAMM|nr:hypothetical protein [Spartinivicinus sp. A2-2]MDE1464350.1 hypothetical protein [Spartinivicinus sp. A2-2]